MKVAGCTTFHTLYSNIYIYIQVFSNIFLKNQRNTQRNASSQKKTTEIIVYFCENERKQIIPQYLHGYFMRFALYLWKFTCSATITGNIRIISWRNRPHIPATGAKTSPLPVIYPPPPGYASWLAAWRSFLIFLKNFGIIYIENKGNIKHFPDFHNNNIRFIRRKKNELFPQR